MRLRLWSFLPLALSGLWAVGCGSTAATPFAAPGASSSASSSASAPTSPTLPDLPPPVTVPVEPPFAVTWSRTWQTGAAQMPDGTASVSGMTVREVMHTSIAGETVKITYSNALGADPLVIAAAHVGLHDAGTAIVGGSDQILTFSGAGTITVAPGATVVSDPLVMHVAAFADVAVTTFYGDTPAIMTGNPYPIATSYVAKGDQTGSTVFTTGQPAVLSYYLTAMDVSGVMEATPPVVVGFGDSVVDGNGSTIDANHRWLDVLAQRMAGTSPYAAKGVANAGIVGNRLLYGPLEPVIFYGPSGVSRFAQDALAVPGVETVIVSIGLNDIGATENGAAPQTEKVTVAQLEAGYQTLIQQAHAQHVRIVAATLTPISGFYGLTSADEAERQELNAWLRSGTSGYDGIIDFDAVVRDPANPAQLLPAYNSGDSIHPNDAGYALMAAAVDLSLL